MKINIFFTSLIIGFSFENFLANGILYCVLNKIYLFILLSKYWMQIEEINLQITIYSIYSRKQQRFRCYAARKPIRNRFAISV